jgi:hypothetical protein
MQVLQLLNNGNQPTTLVANVWCFWIFTRNERSIQVLEGILWISILHDYLHNFEKRNVHAYVFLCDMVLLNYTFVDGSLICLNP